MSIVKIQGYDFDIAPRYAEGHALTANEAAALNQVRAENIRNNAAGKIKAAKDKNADFDLDAIYEGSETSLRQDIEAYATTYEFGARVARASEPADPVEREAKRIATETLNTALKAKNIKRKDLSDEQYDGALADLMARDDIKKEAKRRVDSKNKIALDDLNFGDETSDTPIEDTVEGSEG
jgi:hypothetical protein